MHFKTILFALLAIFIAGICYLKNDATKLPVIAIANYGPHSSLENAIKGIKAKLHQEGFEENKHIKFEIKDVGFDSSLIPQMITKLKSHHPKVMIVMTTPVAQFAKNAVTSLPLIFNVITDPVEAGLLKSKASPEKNMTGASDKQDLSVLCIFVKKLIPHAKNIGVLYSTSEANDLALVKMLNSAASIHQMKVIAIPINEARDVTFRMEMFKGKVDFIYVGASGPIQPSLPAIIAAADKMKIPVLNVDEQAVLDHQVLASFGVNYFQVGVNAGKMITRILKGEKVSDILPSYPQPLEHRGFVSAKRAKQYGINIPANLNNVIIVE